MDIKPHESILDVGCGDGYSFEVFNKQNPIVGVDIRPTKYSAPNFRFILADAADLPFDDKEFDVAISIGVFEHIRPFSKLIKASLEIRRVAKRFLVVVPAISTLIEPHYQRPFWHLRDHNKKMKIIRSKDISWYKRNASGKYEHIIYMSDESWLELDGFRDANTYRYNYIPLLVQNLFIYKL